MVEYNSGSSLYLPVYKSTFYQPKNRSKKITLDLFMGQKLRSNKFWTNFLCNHSILYLKENSKIKDKFFRKILTQK